MNIFNSLGSNYDLEFALRTLFTQDQINYSNSLKQFLEKKYGGKAFLFYKGREAIKAALDISGISKGSAVAINGFTCWAVYEAIHNAGYEVEYLDIDKNLNFSPKILEEGLNKNPKIKTVIVQNTLGNPCQISAIAQICHERNILLMEDLAHSVGTKYENGEEAGTVGDLVVFSFSQDKIVDSVSGGALIIRNKKYQNEKLPPLEKLNLGRQYKDRLYPLLTFMIRKSYEFGLGKILHLFLKKLNLLSKPIESENIIKVQALPNWYCSLINSGFDKLSKDLEHRKRISSIYARNFDKRNLFPAIVQQILNSTNLRFPIFVKNRRGLIEHLKKNNIFVSDIWYDAPIAPKRFLSQTDYKNQCPNSDRISSAILNLPTHVNVSEESANIICQKINQWLKSQ